MIIQNADAVIHRHIQIRVTRAHGRRACA